MELRSIYWFRNDLRLSDNLSLNKALDNSKYILFLNDSGKLPDNNGTAFKEVFHNSRNGALWFGVEFAEHRFRPFDHQGFFDSIHFSESGLKQIAGRLADIILREIQLESNNSTSL